jgi:hypothetical protein
MDQDVQKLVSGFIKAKQDAAKGPHDISLFQSHSEGRFGSYCSQLTPFRCLLFRHLVEDFASAKLYKVGYDILIKVGVNKQLFAMDRPLMNSRL